MALRITRITIENYKRIKLVEFELDPDGNLVIISGANASGKTSLLDGIENTLNGMRNAPAIPVRIGAKKSKVALQIGDRKEPNQFTVRRVTDAVTRRSSLIITAADGREYSSPQTFLDALLGPLSFDPLAFARMEPRKQAAQLQELVGIDFTDLDKGLAIQQEERTAAGRDVKRIKGSFESLTFHEDAGEKMIVESLMEELEERQRLNAINKELRNHAAKMELEMGTAYILFGSEKERLMDAVRALEKAKIEVGKLKVREKNAIATHNLARKERALALESIEGLVDANEDEVRADIARAEEHNEKYRENGRYLEARTQLQEAEKKHQTIKDAIEASGEAREEMLAKAKFPVEGLGFDEHGVTYYNVPFSQASSAQQLRVSLAIVLDMNPKIAVVLIRDGSLLDKKSRNVVATMVAEAGAQCLMECTDDEGSGERSIVIEDGMIQEREKA